MNDKKQENGTILWGYEPWWQNGACVVALAFLFNALALLWLLLFDAVPRETLGWIVDGAWWVLAAGFGAMK
jgi:hypothetical protein